MTHHTKGGEVYDRGDQYSDARKRQVEHKAKFFWSGSRLKEPSTLMVGYLAMIGDDWEYGETVFRKPNEKQPVYEMKSKCRYAGDQVHN